MSFHLQDHEIDPQTHVIEVVGEMDLYTAPELKGRIHGLIDSGKTQVVVDLSQAPFIDSTGLGVLVSALKRLRAKGGALVVVSTDESMLMLFRSLGLDRAIPIFDNQEEGVEAVRDDSR